MVTAEQQQRGRADRQAEHSKSNQALSEQEFQGFRARTMPECRKICQQLNHAAFLHPENRCHPHLLWSRCLSSGEAGSASHPAEQRPSYRQPRLSLGCGLAGEGKRESSREVGKGVEGDLAAACRRMAEPSPPLP